MSNIFKGIHLNESDPRNFDSDIDYYDSLNKPRRSRSEDDYVEPYDDEPIRFQEKPVTRPQYSISKDEDRQAGYNMTLTVKAPTTQKAQWAAQSYVDSEWGAKKQIGDIQTVADGVVQVHMIDNHKHGYWKPWADEPPISKGIEFNESTIIDEANKLLEGLSPESRTSVINELSNELLGRYKKAAGADASAADKKGDYERGNKRFKGIVKATKKEFDNDTRGVAEGPGFDKWADDRAASQLYKLNIPKTWEVSYDYGPHMTKTVKVKASSEEEAIAKVEKAAEKRGLDIMINSVTPVEQGVSEGSRKSITPEQMIRDAVEAYKKESAKENPNPYILDSIRTNINGIKREIERKKQGVAEGWKEKVGAAALAGAVATGAGANTPKVPLDKAIQQATAVYNINKAVRKHKEKEAEKRKSDKKQVKEQDVAEGSLEEYGDTAKGQKMLTKVQKRAVDRVTSKKADTDPAYAKKNKDTADRAWDRMTDKDVTEDQLDEKWSQKYKDSINCSNPKGFSQKAHCASKQKNESAIMKGLKL